MNKQLSEAFDEWDEARIQFIQLLEKCPRELRAEHPKEGWNMLQVMEHVITSEVGTLEYMMKKTQAPAAEIPVAGAESATGSAQLNRALKSEGKWKKPDVLPDPTGAQSFDNMAAYWENLREKYRAFLDDLDPAYFDRAIFKHPFSGRLNLYQTVEFLTNHLVHHGYQLARICKELEQQ